MLDKYKRLVWPYASAANVFVVISAVFGFIFIMNIPPLWGADETSHIGRIYQLSKGHLTANFFGYTRQQMGYGGNIPSNLYKMIVTTNADLTDNATASSIYGTKNVDSPVPYQTVGRLPLQSGKYTQYPFPNTAAYSLVAYLPEVPGMLFARLVNLSVTHTIELIRLCDLVFYIAVVYLALRLLGALRIRWLFFTIALMPTAIFQASIITADAVTLCLVIY